MQLRLRPVLHKAKACAAKANGLCCTRLRFVQLKLRLVQLRLRCVQLRLRLRPVQLRLVQLT